MKKYFLIILFALFSSSVFAWTETIQPGVIIKAVHVNELRNVINLKRTCYGLTPRTWIDDPVIGGTTIIKAAHIQEMRNAVNDIYTSCSAGLCTGGSGVWTGANATWTDTNLSGLQMKATHILQLRNVLNTITCTPYTYAWLAGSTGACTGGSGTYSYSAWSACGGGYSYWRSENFGSCSASCGSGTRPYDYNCYYSPYSGTQTRSGSCNFNANSGTATRSVVCQRNDSTIVNDSYCSSTPKPPTTVACTPNNPAVCGSPVLSQSCTPGNGRCGGYRTSQYCYLGACCASYSETVTQNFQARCDPCTPINADEPYNCYYSAANYYGQVVTATCYPGLVYYCSASGGSPTNINCPTQPTAISRSKTCGYDGQFH